MKSIAFAVVHSFEVLNVLLNPQAPFLGLVAVGVMISIAVVTCNDWAVAALCLDESAPEK